MATGWAQDGAVQDQIDATVKDGIKRAKSQLPTGPSLESCAECGAKIPEARREAIPGVRLCVACQEAHDQRGRAQRRLQPPRQQGQPAPINGVRPHFLAKGAGPRSSYLLSKMQKGHSSECPFVVPVSPAPFPGNGV